LALDENDQIDPLETELLRGSVFKINKVLKDGDHFVADIKSSDYPYEPDEGMGHYVDTRMVRLYWSPAGKLAAAYADKKASEKLPTAAQILNTVESLSGSIYVWGGDDPRGVPTLEKLYPPKTPLTPEMRKKWTLQGVDCSGLLYYATNGLTPRNTSSIVQYGTGLTIADKSVDEIIALTKPLDIIAWK